MSDGIGCVCSARSENECCCGTDWTPKELIDLRQQLSIRDAEIADLNNRLVTLGGIASTHVGEKEKLRKQVTLLRDVVSAPFVEWIRAQHNLTYKHGVDTDFPQNASGIWLDDVYEALAATEPSKEIPE